MGWIFPSLGLKFSKFWVDFFQVWVKNFPVLGWIWPLWQKRPNLKWPNIRLHLLKSKMSKSSSIFRFLQFVMNHFSELTQNFIFAFLSFLFWEHGQGSFLVSWVDLELTSKKCWIMQELKYSSDLNNRQVRSLGHGFLQFSNGPVMHALVL